VSSQSNREREREREAELVGIHTVFAKYRSVVLLVSIRSVGCC
jgi:hypothetical protein